MRTILYTGKGGVGKTSIAAATACKIADSGKKVLIMSTDQAHSLGDSFETKLQNVPTEIFKNLYAFELDVIMENEKLWGKTRKYIEKILLFKSEESINIEELLVFPGLEELISLLKIREFSREGKYDVLIVDCAPTGESMSLLKFPELFKWWMAKVFPIKKKMTGIAKPIVEATIKFPLPDKDTFNEIETLYQNLDELHEILLNKDKTSIRLVTTSEKIVINEAKRSFSNLHLFDFNVDAIIINRVFSEDGAKGYFEKWLDLQNKNIKTIKSDFSPIPIFQAKLLNDELKGFKKLSTLGDTLYESSLPESVLWRDKIFKIQKSDDKYILKINMPFINKSDLEIFQTGDELSIVVKNEKRSFVLPKKLQNRDVTKAKYEKNDLCIHFS